ncbi:MAG: Gfo/Idh/MocA family oxidoreductase [Planctomycetes bacterium]|nr:Gfo/Idh/MocA family oxidoreductase [Planctomycetota bacterium]
MTTKLSLSRRHFLSRCTAAAAGALAAPVVIPASALGLGGAVSPSERVALGFIGAGDHGINRNLKRFLTEPDAQVLAVCDVDRSRREEARKIVEAHYAAAQPGAKYEGCAACNDFREIIGRKDIDAVMVSTPDHWHVLPSVLAAQAGKDVMCEKPLSLTVAEGRVLSDTMKRQDRIFQTASENRSLEVYHRMCELVRNGRIGKIQAIRVGLPNGHWVRTASKDVQPPPEGFDFDLWLGPAPAAEYCPARCHWNFRWIFDYSGGMLTDWGAHLIDIAQWGNDTERTGPVEVEGKGQFPDRGLYETATEFHVECRYASGVLLTIDSKQPSIRFEGTGGWIESAGWGGPLKASSDEILQSRIGENEVRLYTCPAGEQRNFLDGVKSRKPCYAPAEIGHRTITIAHLGNIAMLLGRKLRWDPERERFVKDPAANMMLSRQMRWPWHL